VNHVVRSARRVYEGLVIDLDAYLKRIDYRGPVAPTLPALHALVHAHVLAIPFENLDVLLGRPIVLAPDALMRKLVEERRGGYCFEQNGLLLLVLEAIGFAVKPLSARVRYQRARSDTPTRTHLFARVELEGASWLADVGVGGLSLTSAIRLVEDVEQATPHEARRLVRDGALWFHQVRFGDEWHDVCEFTLEEMPPIDREVASWYTSTHPGSHFKNRLTVARALLDGGRKTLLNRELTVRGRDTTTETRQLESPEELLAVLRQEFDLQFEAGTQFTCPALDWTPGA
jgi:N-hydroxyarylamine O-acetyltransferase